MSAASTIDSTGIERLRKIWALANSPNAGEAAAARERAAVLVAKHGMTVADIPSLLVPKPKGPTPGAAGFTFYDMNNPEHMDAWAVSDRKRRSDRARKEAPEREAVISRYGSIDAALAPCEREALLREAVRQWSTPCDPPHQQWTKRIGEWDAYIRDLPPYVMEALSAAYPLPATIEQAEAEYSYWEQRSHEIGLVLEDTSDTKLDLAAYGRQRIVGELLETGLRAQSLADVLARQRHLVTRQYSTHESEQAVLEDLEHLAAIAEVAPEPVPEPIVQNGHVHNRRHETATDRRAKVIRLLSNMDTARLPDREIARMVGVSPQTVGNIRRKHEAMHISG